MKASKTRERLLTKGQLRNKILLKLKNQKEEDRYKKSRIIKEKLFNSGVFKRAKKIMFYISHDGEVDTQKMIRASQKLGKIVAAPVCRRNRAIKPCLLGAGMRLKKGLYGIREPAVQHFMNPKDLDLVIVPGVVFDKQGNRLGRGKGYYDSFLKKLSKRTASLGLAFDFQILPDLPTAAHDVSVDSVVFA